MTWTASLPAILTVALAGVFFPVFTRRGNSPLPIGLEGDPKGELMTQRDAILTQLKEMELDASNQDAESAILRLQLEQDLGAILTRLDTLKPITASIQAVAPARSPLEIAIAFIVMLLISVLTGGLYLLMGTPEEILPATAQQTLPDDFILMVEQAEKKLQTTPEDVTGWMRLARSYVVMNRPDKAMEAYHFVLANHPEEMNAAVGLSELQLQSQNPQLKAQAIKRLEEILAKDPHRPEALWFLGGAALQAGDKNKALKLWHQLQAELKSDSPARKTVEQAIQQVEKQ